jgi:hypothetical protein
MRGTDLYKLMRLMGHSNTNQTQRYAHLSPEYLGNGATAKRDDSYPKIFPNGATIAHKSQITPANGDQLPLGF